MDTQLELLSLLDLLNLNEEDIDKPLKHIMEKSKHSNKNLRSAVQLLQYKLLVNAQEHSECENDEEFEFVVKLLKDLCSENVDYVCKIVDIVLRLQPTKLVSKAEHLLQQILSNIEFPVTDRNTLFYLKAADSILNAAIIFGEKLSLLFLETPLEKVLDSTDEALKIYFLTNTVPKLVDGSVGYNILDSIWIYIQSLKSDKQENGLKALSCLSDYYLPTPDGQGDSKFVSDIIFQSNFWEMINFGITSDDTAIRKLSVYLTKKAVDCVMATKKDINIKSSDQIIFQWKKNNANVLKSMWDNFFVLIDSLEEKQGNIVLPSLKLFESINIGECWMTAAFNMGLKHENTQVRLKCIEYKLKTKIRNQLEAQTLLEALNDINIYDQSTIFEVLKHETAKLMADSHSFVEIFKAVTNIKWSPVPLYHVTDILANLNIDLSIIPEKFVELITQDALLQNAMYNNIVISYCNKMIEYGPVKTNPLYYLIRRLNKKDFTDYGHLIYVLCEILLYCPVPRKDQRIVDNVTLEVLQNSVKYRINKESYEVHFNYEIQYLAIDTLCSIKNIETLRMITNFITIRIDNTFKNKQRYHGNSTLHRVLLTTLQHILVLVLQNGDLKNVFTWCLDMLVKLPHQPSVRICLEWFIALDFYIQKTHLNEETLQILKSKNVPITSQFIILYWLLKHKITNNTYTLNEFDFVMDFLLSHTMGQLFNVRLNAQYLATNLYKLANKITKHEYTIGVIEKTFAESNSDKNFMKLRSDYFINDFDIIANLTPYFVYYLLPRLCEVDNNENVDLHFIQNIIKNINKSISRSAQNDFINEWKVYRKADDKFEFETNKGVDSKVVEDSEAMGTIQKKYIPWKNMSDVNVYDVGKKRESPSQLIVVASLIDKLPNLGGMARTSEVFGVQTYVVDSLRHLQDKQFQGLSVSAEKWINVEEVRPGRPLKEYLMGKKEEGYVVVAAEQTSTSSKLQGFKFPKKTLLLLGHEKEGVPCDLLPLMDHCVEIPQQGYVRSLNVHVTAAIFVWEYARQNVL
ncbi:hypothetical protein PYW08_001945 [Mythimna loreyi]|uniref:Uncharacterized protein n=1 Tax=Mythimna loreyi TaxID=667449 RepID=A0ACC2R329_9NEOP|nr:hypothetical protein PYW08_001945 [Mythimna loreyi]